MSVGNIYTIKCITNLHMGSGDINFNIIDNEVQRDPVTGYPCMFSSSAKGAFREHFRNHANVTEIFGCEKSNDKKATESNEAGNQNNCVSGQGKIKFLTADILFQPVRAAKGSQAYYLVTTLGILNRFTVNSRLLCGIDKSITFETNVIVIDNNGVESTDGNDIIKIEGKTYTHTILKNDETNKTVAAFLSSIVGASNLEKVVIMKDEDFKEIHLPVLARNHLVNGISDNLWYEEVVPHEAIFGLMVIAEEIEESKNALKNFDEYVKENKIVQFGGNATIGYGLCEVNKLSLNVNKEGEQNG